METIYKKDSKGKLRILNIYTDGADLVQESGLAGGKLVEARKTCKGKNIGKSNETTPEDQALSEMQSKIAEKIKVDYFRTEKEAMNSEVILPMLALEYAKGKKKIDWKKNVYIQPKMDGMRCLIFVYHGVVRLVSRDNTDIIQQYHSMGHIEKAFQDLPDGTYDGELYAHGHTFQENMELIKKYRPGQSEEVKFHAYDFIIDKPYWIRRNHLIIASQKTDVIHLVTTQQIRNEKDMYVYHGMNLQEGFEGSIIRHGDGGYEIDKRTAYLLKLKDFIDVVATIEDVIPMEKRPLQARLVCREKGKNKGEFRANLKFSHKERERILIEKKDYIGKTAEIRFFEYTDDGLPRFPVCVGFRLDK